MKTKKSSWWSGAIVLLIVVAVLIGTLGDTETSLSKDDADFTLAIKDEAQRTLWTVDFFLDPEKVLVTPVSARPVGEGFSYQLWLFTGRHDESVSLGLIDSQASRLSDIPDVDAIDTATSILVTQEKQGGSPSGLPEGHALHLTSLVF